MNLQIIRLSILLFLFVFSCTLKENNKNINQEGKTETEHIGEQYTVKEKEAPKQKNTYELDFLPVDKSISKDLTSETFNDLVKSGLQVWIKYYEDKSEDFVIDSFKNTHTTILQPYQQ